ncbi:MAG: DUF3187 family protein [Deltaproteobacteria bacterium]|nr:DUF3187 family protein [Deltaproteobacteria bacterium]
MGSLALLALGRPLAAQQFEFLPPVPTRNFAPLQLIFLNPPFESAAVMPAGELALLVQTSESSVIATSQGTVDATLKFEQNWTNFGARYAPADHWEVGLDLPFISRYGGFMDPAIDWVEELFGLSNSERSLFPNNTFGGYTVSRNGQMVFDAGEENFQPGDLSLSTKYELSLPREWPRLALRGAVKLPTGNVGAALGSGKPDFGLGVAADYLPWERLMLYGNMNLVIPVGPITDACLTLDPMFTQSFAAHLAITRGFAAMLHQAVYTSPYHAGSRILDGTVVELGLGLGYAWNEHFGTQLMAIENVSGVQQSADFSLMLAFSWKPWALPRALPEVGPPLPHTALPPVGAPAP